MKKLYTLPLLLIAFTVAQAQTVINNTLTPAHTRMPDSRISIILPPGFTIPEHANYAINDAHTGRILAGDMEEYMADTFDVFNAYLAAFDSVETITVYTINNTRSVLVTGTAKWGRNTRMYAIVYGSGKKAQMVRGSFPYTDTAGLGNQIKQSLLSLVCEPRTPGVMPDGVFDNLDFTVSAEGSGYMFADEKNGALVFSVDGYFNKRKLGNLVFVAQDKLPEKKGKSWKSYVVKTTNDKKTTVKSIKATKQYGVEGYIIEGVLTEDGEKKNIYAIMLFGKRMYLMAGIYNTPEQLAGIKKIFGTFKLK